MTRRILLTALVCGTALVGLSATQANAGWGFKPPKIKRPKPPKIIRRPNIPAQPGPYQRGMGKAIIKGYDRGSEAAGTVFGPAGKGVGGAMGAVFGGANYAHEHDSNKVHNYRTPNPITQVAGTYRSNYGTVVIAQNGNQINGTIYYTSGGTGGLWGNVSGNTVYFNWRNYNNGETGSGQLRVSNGSRQLNGSFQSNRGNSGVWKLSR